MDWDVTTSRQVDKFLKMNHLKDEDFLNPVIRGINKLSGEKVSVDLKRMTGNWNGYFRVRSGKKRVIFSVDFLNKKAHIEVFDFRGNVY